MRNIAIVSIVAFLATSLAELISYRCVVTTFPLPANDNRGTLVNPSQPLFLSIPKYSPEEVPDWSPGNGRSFVGTIFRLKQLNY